MEEFDFKRMMMAFVICMAIMWGWMYITGRFNPPDEQPQTPAPTATTQTPSAAPAAASTSADQAAAQTPVQLAPPLAVWHVQMVQAPTQDIIIGDHNKTEGGFKVQLVLDGKTAAVREALLSEHKLNVKDKEYGYPLLNSVIDENQKTYHSLMLGELRLAGRNERFDLSAGCWTLINQQSQSDGSVLCQYAADILDDKSNKVLQIVKTYRLDLNQYDLNFELAFNNLSSSPVQVESLDLIGPVGLFREDPRSDRYREFLAAYEVQDQDVRVERKYIDSIASKPEKRTLDVPGGANSLFWYGFANKFFASVVHPLPQQNAPRVDYLNQSQIIADAFSWRDNIKSEKHPKPLAVKTTLAMPQPMPAGGKNQYQFQLYMGPIDRDLFNNPAYPQYAERHYEKLVHVSSCAFEWLTYLLLTIMNGVYKVVGNYGIAIMVLVLLVRVVLHPITKRSQVSMMKMGKLGPQMEEIKKKYAGNQQEIQKRTMALYKEQGFSPVLGCLPMLLQMPIWVALYTAVNANVALRHKGLFPSGWLCDLSSPDRLIPFSVFGIDHPVNVPLVGGIDAINLLPILLCVAMFLQTKLSPQAKMSAATNPQAAQQQKMMLYMMPIMMLVFFFAAPSGLNLYIMASTFCGVIEQYIIRKHIKEKEAQEALVTVAGTKKITTAFGPKKKKPKPPFKHM